MITRCYDPKRVKQFPTYGLCTVADEWLLFSNFRGWCILQESTKGINIQDLHLDKDLLIKDNKVYSPQFCIFVEPKINTFLLDSGASRGECLIGVNLNKTKTKYEAWCRSVFTRKQVYLGVFDTEIEAHKVWKSKKQELAIVLAEMYLVKGSAEYIALSTRYL